MGAGPWLVAEGVGGAELLELALGLLLPVAELFAGLAAVPDVDRGHRSYPSSSRLDTTREMSP